MPKKEGETLQELIKNSGKIITEIINLSGIARATMYKLFEQDVIRDAYKTKLLKANIDFGTLKQGGHTLSEPEQQYNKAPKSTTNTGDTEIIMLKTKIEHLEDQLEAAQIVIKEQTKFQKHFSTDAKCRLFLEEQRWGNTPGCVFCGSTDCTRIKEGKRFQCNEKECRKQFSVTVGTIYENTKIPLTKWFYAIYILSNHSKGISSLQLASWLDVTQKTAWYLNHRIRQMLTFFISLNSLLLKTFHTTETVAVFL